MPAVLARWQMPAIEITARERDPETDRHFAHVCRSSPYVVETRQHRAPVYRRFYATAADANLAARELAGELDRAALAHLQRWQG